MQHEANKLAHLSRNAAISGGAGFVEASSLNMIYIGLFAKYFGASAGSAISGFGAFILHPLIIIASAVNAALAWTNTVIDKRKKDNKLKNRHLANAIISTISFAGFTTALVGLLAAATAFALAGPVIFMAVIGGNVIYNSVMAIYNKYRASHVDKNKYTTEASQETARKKYNTRATIHAKNAGLGLIAFSATTAVFLLGYLVFAPIGIVLSTALMVMSIIGIAKGIHTFIENKKRAEFEAVEEIESLLPNNEIEEKPLSDNTHINNLKEKFTLEPVDHLAPLRLQHTSTARVSQEGYFSQKDNRGSDHNQTKENKFEM